MSFQWAGLLRLRRREPTPDTLVHQRAESLVAQLGAGFVNHQGILRHLDSAPDSTSMKISVRFGCLSTGP
jgi:hypothetical protein